MSTAGRRGDARPGLPENRPGKMPSLTAARRRSGSVFHRSWSGCRLVVGEDAGSASRVAVRRGAG